MARTLVAGTPDAKAREAAPAAPTAPDVDVAARRSLRAQIARIERELAALPPLELPPPRLGTARLLSLGELEAVRDQLADRLSRSRSAAAAVGVAQDRARVRLERMLLHPGEHRFERVYLSELGEDGCGAYAVRPRLGLVGMFMGWWQVKLSSGCPLPAPSGPVAHARRRIPRRPVAT